MKIQLNLKIENKKKFEKSKKNEKNIFDYFENFIKIIRNKNYFSNDFS